MCSRKRALKWRRELQAAEEHVHRREDAVVKVQRSLEYARAQVDVRGDRLMRGAAELAAAEQRAQAAEEALQQERAAYQLMRLGMPACLPRSLSSLWLGAGSALGCLLACFEAPVVP